MKETACWIRGEMSQRDLQDDPVRQATQECPYRKARGGSIFGGNDHKCTHPAVTGEYVATQSLPGGGVMAGGVDGFATFCAPVDLHLTSLGEKSRFILEGEWTDVTDQKLLPPPKIT